MKPFFRMKLWAILFAVLVLSIGVAALPAAAPVQEAKPTTPATVVVPAQPKKGLRYAMEVPGYVDALKSALDEYYSSTSNGLFMPEMADRNQLEILPPITVYKISAEDVLKGRGLSSAKLVSWLADVKAFGILVGRTVVHPLDSDGTYTGRGVAVFDDYRTADLRAVQSKFLDEIAYIQSLAEIKNGSYEFRILELPPYAKVPDPLLNNDPRVRVYWLKSDVAGGDLIYVPPYETREAGLQPGKLYKAVEMLKLIEPAVKAYVASPVPPPTVLPYGVTRSDN